MTTDSTPNRSSTPTGAGRIDWQILIGVLAALASHFPGQYFLAWMIRSPLALMAIAVSQFVYLAPLWFLIRSRSIRKGIVIGAALTALLSIACYGWFTFAYKYE